MNFLASVGRYLWGFFVGDLFQFVALILCFVVVALLAHALGPWDGLVAFALVGGIVVADAWRRARPRRS